MTCVLQTSIFTLSAVISLSASAQSFPTKPIRLIVPFAPGGSTDIIARAVGDALGRQLGQPVIVENKAGGGGSVGALEVMRAPKDGYTIGMATVSTTAANPAINPKIGYDPIKDFTAITNIAATPNIIAVNPSFPAKDFKTFMAVLKANPGKYSYSSSGTGGIGHLQTELFKSLAGVFIVHIPYRGAGPALADTVGGQVSMIFDNLPSSLPFIKDGKLIPIVIAAPKRLAQLPNVPTFAEVGLVPVNRMAYYGFLGPAGMPKEIVDKYYAAVQKAVAEPAVLKRIEETGSIINVNGPEAFSKEIKAEYAVYKEVVAKQKLQLD
ncbi:tripartite tricarboxylate transporter substrate binding protein BugE [Polynucleobacter sp. Latsch14-2]|uniref:tripartite tricarboxylate transporter substrate binding protein BugE n=1 Tax=Polynucleobacter sp. Latsch14-2 TaxID=2576920 RepID=UPI001C0D4696|nr:tripartite tricarboxylate transporter substrate binding protein BugE [Polynucleobacter sp. Latsch14-2]MBU3615005.1 tripartite tricarboxylate transporter substrate binding protein BugE [Polynucleobacter sp. Latsch14-2]